VNAEIVRRRSALEAAAACAERILALLEDALSQRPLATLAVSGGSTPKLMFHELAARRFDWQRVHLFWVDERAVPPSDPRSNYGMAEQAFIKPASFPDENVHRIKAELTPRAAADEYVASIRKHFGGPEASMPVFDVIQHGVGPDCHTASLFPGEPLINDRAHLAAAVYVDKLADWRITLLPGVLLAARHTVALVSGEDKAEAVRAVFREPFDPLSRPAQLIAGGRRSVAWFLDEAAARLIA
jgi:6-phosphogluconolactonase